MYCYRSLSTASQNKKVDLLPLLGLDPVIFSTPAHSSDRLANSHPFVLRYILVSQRQTSWHLWVIYSLVYPTQQNPHPLLVQVI
jgi:hypothetical protein